MTSEGALARDALGPTVCVGEILVEIVATTVGEGFLEPQPLVGPFPSGAPAIFIDQCARMGGSAAMVGAVGDDDFGRLNIARLARAGGGRVHSSWSPSPPSSAQGKRLGRSCIRRATRWRRRGPPTSPWVVGSAAAGWAGALASG